MYGKGGAFTLSLIVLQCRKSTDSNDSLYNSWQVLEHNKISDRWTDKGGGGLRSAYSPSTFLKQQEDYKE